MLPIKKFLDYKESNVPVLYNSLSVMAASHEKIKFDANTKNTTVS